MCARARSCCAHVVPASWRFLASPWESPLCRPFLFRYRFILCWILILAADTSRHGTPCDAAWHFFAAGVWRRRGLGEERCVCVCQCWRDWTAIGNTVSVRRDAKHSLLYIHWCAVPLMLMRVHVSSLRPPSCPQQVPDAHAPRPAEPECCAAGRGREGAAA